MFEDALSLFPPDNIVGFAVWAAGAWVVYGMLLPPKTSAHQIEEYNSEYALIRQRDQYKKVAVEKKKEEAELAEKEAERAQQAAEAQAAEQKKLAEKEARQKAVSEAKEAKRLARLAVKEKEEEERKARLAQSEAEIYTALPHKGLVVLFAPEETKEPQQAVQDVEPQSGEKAADLPDVALSSPTPIIHPNQEEKPDFAKLRELVERIEVDGRQPPGIKTSELVSQLGYTPHWIGRRMVELGFINIRITLPDGSQPHVWIRKPAASGNPGTQTAKTSSEPEETGKEAATAGLEAAESGNETGSEAAETGSEAAETGSESGNTTESDGEQDGGSP